MIATFVDDFRIGFAGDEAMQETGRDPQLPGVFKGQLGAIPLAIARSALPEIDRDNETLAARSSGLDDPEDARRAVELAAEAAEAAETLSLSAETEVADARAAEAAAREPVQSARSELQRVETEARDLADIVST